VEFRAQIFAPLEAPAAFTAGAVDPGDTDPLFQQSVSATGALPYHDAHDLVSGCHRQAGGRRAPLDFVDLGVAHATGAHADKHFALSRFRRCDALGTQWQFGPAQGTEAVDAHGAHFRRNGHGGLQFTAVHHAKA